MTISDTVFSDVSAAVEKEVADWNAKRPPVMRFAEARDTPIEPRSEPETSPAPLPLPLALSALRAGIDQHLADIEERLDGRLKAIEHVLGIN